MPREPPVASTAIPDLPQHLVAGHAQDVALFRVVLERIEASIHALPPAAWHEVSTSDRTAQVKTSPEPPWEIADRRYRMPYDTRRVRAPMKQPRAAAGECAPFPRS